MCVHVCVDSVKPWWFVQLVSPKSAWNVDLTKPIIAKQVFHIMQSQLPTFVHTHIRDYVVC